MVTRKKPEVKKIKVLKKPSKRKLVKSSQGNTDIYNDNRFVLATLILPPYFTRCIKNKLRAIENIPYMSADAAVILRQYGFVDSNSFVNIDVYAEYDRIVCPIPSMPSWKKQIIINGLRVGYEYANGRQCFACCELEKLLFMIPGLNSTAAKLLLKAFGTAQAVYDMLAIGPSQVGTNASAYVWYIYDWVFSTTDVCPGEAKLLHEGLTYAVALVNGSTLQLGPGYGSRSPPN